MWKHHTVLPKVTSASVLDVGEAVIAVVTRQLAEMRPPFLMTSSYGCNEEAPKGINNVV